MPFESGLRIGKYELGKKLGEGGFGEVYVARDTGLDRDVALKFLHVEHTRNLEMLQRFLQEARSAAKIPHPGIVTIFEAGQVTGTDSDIDGTAFIAMELLPGESLGARLEREGRLAPAAALEICRQIASALEATHKAGIVHRDLKPDNVFLTPDPAMPSGERVKVLDFGVAKLAATSSVHTLTSMVFGTPRYMSPEQCKSSANIDHRSDIYTLGCILFELICGRAPFTGESGELIAKHQLVDPPTAASLVSIPDTIDQTITMLLAKEPSARPQSMAQVQEQLVACATLPGIGQLAPPAAASAAVATAPTLAPSSPDAIATAPALVRRPPEPQAPAPAPAPTPTTMSSAAGSQASAPATSSPRTRYALLGIAGAAIVGGGAWFALHASDDAPSPPAPPADAAAVAAVAVTPPPSAPPPPADAAPVTIDAAAIVEDAAMTIAVPADAPSAPPKTPTGPAAGAARFDRATLTSMIQRCRGEHVRRNPGDPPSGTLTLDARVTADGKATGTATGVSTDIQRCVTQRLAATAFAVTAPSTLRVDVTWVDPLRRDPPPTDPPPTDPPANPPPHKSPLTNPGKKIVEQVNAGPIWDSADANTKCPAVCKAPATWTGGWRTTVPGKMSTCDCEAPVD